MCGQPVFALKLLDNPSAATDGVARVVIPAANATIVTSTRTRRSIANIRSRYAGHPKISTVRCWLLDGGPPMNDGFGTRTAQFDSRGANDRFGAFQPLMPGSLFGRKCPPKPTFTADRGRWVEMMKTSVGRLAPRFSMHRAVIEYTERYYVPATRACGVPKLCSHRGIIRLASGTEC